jgi:hypothetical protein
MSSRVSNRETSDNLGPRCRQDWPGSNFFYLVGLYWQGAMIIGRQLCYGDAPLGSSKALKPKKGKDL